MCGIAALLRRRGPELDRAQLQRIAASLHHRGPDAQGVELLDDGRLGLVATRLAIIDPDAAPQPVVNEDRSIFAVINGELYDHRELGRALERRGHRLRSRCDAELIVHLYEEQGPEFVRELDGDFALILWDARARRLLASRDRIGARPLFVQEGSEQLMLGSELKAFAALGQPLSLAPEYLRSHLFGVYDGRSCAFAGIEPLPAAALWTWSPDPKRSVYWRWPERRSEDPPQPDELLAALERATARRVQADVPAGLLFSGGLDSAVVAVTALEHAELPGFCVGFSEARFDESLRAAEHARALGLELDIVRVDDEALAAELPATIRAIELAPINAHCVARYLLARHVRSCGVKVVLGGEGSDELFAGYPFFAAEVAWRRDQGGGSSSSTTPGAGLLDQVLELAPGSPLAWASFFEVRAAQHDATLDRLLQPRWRPEPGTGPLASMRAELERRRELAPLELSRGLALAQLHDYLIPALGDRVEMAHGVEGRPVFFAPEIVELAARCRESELLDADGSGKLIVRRASAARLPAALRSVPKHPFLAPSWRRVLATTSGRALVERYLGRAATHEFGVFQPNTLAFIRDRWERLAPAEAAGHRYDWLIGLALGVHVLIDTFDLV